MIFEDRVDAGRRLAKQLSSLRGEKDLVVLGIPRGGVPVAWEVAQALDAPLDIFLSRKLGVPGQEELAFGAVAAGDGRFLDQAVIQAARITAQQVEEITAATRKKLDERARIYRNGRSAIDIAGKTVVLVDDGIATGASIFAAVHALRQMHPRRIIVAAPVAPHATSTWLRREADDVVLVAEPEPFYAVGQFYDDFRQTTDDEAIQLLQRGEVVQKKTVQRADAEAGHVHSANGGIQREVLISVQGKRLAGTLSIPNHARGIVLFVHGSGCSRHSPRNQYVARALQAHGMATLLFDLLTGEEEQIDRVTASMRFNIPMLATRLIAATRWIRQQESIKALPVGCFGVSTGTAAALVAAAELPESIGAVVSRGGRPDLAGEALAHVRAATLLIVGSHDPAVLQLNQQALKQLNCRPKEIRIVPGATHLFEEPGALEQVAELAAGWFSRNLLVSTLSTVSSGSFG